MELPSSGKPATKQACYVLWLYRYCTLSVIPCTVEYGEEKDGASLEATPQLRNACGLMWKITHHFKESSAKASVSKPDVDALEQLLGGGKIVEKLSQLKSRRAAELGKVSSIEEPCLPTGIKMGNVPLNPILLA